jgi:hypothetical protein
MALSTQRLQCIAGRDLSTVGTSLASLSVDKDPRSPDPRLRQLWNGFMDQRRSRACLSGLSGGAIDFWVFRRREREWTESNIGRSPLAPRY